MSESLPSGRSRSAIAAAELLSRRVLGGLGKASSPLTAPLGPGLVLAVSLLRFWGPVFSPVPLGDEHYYLGAFLEARAGESPYVVGYYYPPFFAAAGARALPYLGEIGTLGVLRGLNLVGLTALAWFSTALLPSRWRIWVALGSVLLLPSVSAGMNWGNLSVLTAGLVVPALTLLEIRRHRGSLRLRDQLGVGALLGLSIAIKPVTAVVPGLLLARSRDEVDGVRVYTPAASTAVLLTAVLILPFPHLADFLNVGSSLAAQPSSGALLHGLYLLGARPSPIVVMVVVAAVAYALIRRRSLDCRQFMGVLVTASILSSPVVWPHTFLLALPLQLWAAERAILRWRRQVSRLAPELALVGLSILAIQSPNPEGFVGGPWPLVYVLIALLDCLAPMALLAYLLGTSPTPAPPPPQETIDPPQAVA